MCIGLGMGLGIIGAGVQAAGSLMAASQRSAGMKAQAAVADRQAEIEGEAGAYKMGQQRRAQSRMLGTQIAASAANGISPNSGSFEAAVDDSLAESEMDIAATRYGAGLRSSNYRAQAGIYRSNAKAAKSAGYIGALSPIIRTGGRLALNGAFV